jgi:signal transduction histidine kinase
MSEFDELISLLHSGDKDKAIEMILACKNEQERKDFAIKRLEHDNNIVKNFLNRTINDLEISNLELNLIRQKELALKDEEIRSTQYHLNKIINEVSSGFAFLNMNQVYVNTNSTYIKWSNNTFENVIGHTIKDILGNQRYEELRNPIEYVLKGKRKNIDTSFEDIKGNIIYLRTSFIPSYSMDEVMNGFYIFEQDVTSLKEKELLLEVKNQELKSYIESNLQLENFAHIASHDLKAPLSNIVNFSQLLSKTAESKLADTEKKFLGFITKSVENMQLTIESLFNFSLASNTNLQLAEVSIKEILDEVIIDIRMPVKLAKAVIHLGAFPDTIICDKQLMKQLFQNLILNGVKFREQNTQPVVDISCIENKENYEFEVRDNGIGIPIDFREKIFMIFQRLHTQNQYSGSGIGLALCKKIIDLHQGKIWIEGAEGAGSIFKFTIKKTEIHV